MLKKNLILLTCFVVLVLLCGCEGTKRYLVKNAVADEVYYTIMQLCSEEGMSLYYQSLPEGILKYNSYVASIGSSPTMYTSGPFDNAQGPRLTKTLYEITLTVTQEGGNVIMNIWWGAALMTSVTNPHGKILNIMKKKYEIEDL